MAECKACHKDLYQCKICGNMGCKSKPGKCPGSGFHPWVDKCLKCGKYESELAG